MGILLLLKWKIAHITNMAHPSTRKADGISSALGSLEIPSLEVSSQDTSRRLGITWATDHPRLMGGGSRAVSSESLPAQ